MSLANLAIAYWNLGLPADPLWERAIADADASLGPDHELSAGLRANFAIDRRDVDYQGAKRLREEALAVYLKVYGPDHPRVAWVNGELGEDALYVGDYEAASRYLESAIRADEAHPDATQELYAFHLQSLARCRAETGRSAEARVLFERSLAVAEATFGPEHPDLIKALEPYGGLPSRNRRSRRRSRRLRPGDRDRRAGGVTGQGQGTERADRARRPRGRQRAYRRRSIPLRAGAADV